MKIYSIDDMRRVLTMPDVLDALRILYEELGHGRAANRSRTDMYSATSVDNGVYVLKSMDGLVPRLGVGSIRLNSDIITWHERAGGVHKEKVPAVNGRWVGLVLLFSTATGEPLAIMPDGYIQRMRVGGTSALGLDLMARKDAKVLALFGSGWQAGGQLLAACTVRDFATLRVYSPNPASRTRFAAEIREELGRAVTVCEHPEDAVDGADVLLCATNSIDPVIQARWLRKGMHVGVIRNSELPIDAFDIPMRIVVHSHEARPQDIVTAGTPRVRELDDNVGWFARRSQVDWPALPTLADVFVGRAPGRESDEEITCFFNPIGLGAQFTAVGAKMLELAAGLDIGHDIPTEWFTQDVHP